MFLNAGSNGGRYLAPPNGNEPLRRIPYVRLKKSVLCLNGFHFWKPFFVVCASIGCGSIDSASESAYGNYGGGSGNST